MAQVVADLIWYPNGYPGPAVDLTKVEYYCPDPKNPNNSLVWFRHQPQNPVSYNTIAFEAAALIGH